MRQKISFQHRVEYLGYRFIEKLICAIPDHGLPAVARLFAFFIFYLLGIRKKVSLENLSIAFPEKPASWRKQIAYFSYLHFSLVILEFMKMQKWDHRKLSGRIRRAEIQEVLKVANTPPGAIIVSGHYGNWELAIGYFFSQGVLSTVIQQNQQNELVNRRMKILRQQWGMKIVDTRGAVSACEQALKSGRMVALLGDQDAGHRGVFVPFFSRHASTHVGAAMLQRKTGAKIFLGTGTRVRGNRFDIKMSPVITPKPSLNPDKYVTELTAVLMRQLEREVTRHPEQYFWMHKRWKSSPDSRNSV